MSLRTEHPKPCHFKHNQQKMAPLWCDKANPEQKARKVTKTRKTKNTSQYSMTVVLCAIPEVQIQILAMRDLGRPNRPASLRFASLRFAPLASLHRRLACPLEMQSRRLRSAPLRPPLRFAPPPTTLQLSPRSRIANIPFRP